MDFKFLFLSFDGRINRAKYWLCALALAPVWIAGLILDLATSGNLGVFYVLSVLLCMVPIIALNIKRCHDRDRTGWFMILCFIPIISIWYLVEAGFLKGTTGANRYGPDPLQPAGNAATAGTGV
jgi:uncharacterized membrane protein YhaH (DUF805 family)